MTTKITSANITQSGTSGISSVAWQAVQTTGFTAVAGMAYPCDTTSAAFTVTLPASPAAGNVITLTDYAGTWDTNNLTIARNGNLINGATSNVVLNVNRASAQLVYVDATQGWVAYSGWAATSLPNPTVSVEYLVVAGGGGGGGYSAGGGGAGGYKASTLTVNLSTALSIIIGGPGAGGAAGSLPQSTNGSDSTFSTITSTGGGGGGGYTGGFYNGKNGGSGGGAAYAASSKGLGTAGQGNDGGNGGGSGDAAGGGGGSGGLGGNAGSGTGGSGGLGTQNSISGSSLFYAAGGGGGVLSGTGGSGGSSIGGNGGANANGSNAPTANRGSGGGGGGGTSGAGGNGSSGVVILKIPNTNTATFSGGVTSSLSTAVAGYKIYTVTATSTTSETVTFS